MRRDILPLLGLFIFLTAFGGFAYFTQNPDSPWLVRAEQWPWVGDLAHQFRLAYSPAPEEPTWKPPKTEVVMVQPPPRQPGEGLGLGGINPVPHGDPTAFSSQLPKHLQSESLPLPRPILEHRWFLPGHPLFADKKSNAAPKTRLTALARLPVLTWDETWAEVLLVTEPFWLDANWQPSPPTASQKPKGRFTEFAQHARKRLSIAQELMGIRGQSAMIGTHPIYTDTDDPRVFVQLETITELGPAAYAARYDRSTAGSHDWAIVLFSREADYREFARSSENPRPETANGHAEPGQLALFLEGQSLTEFLTIVAHEQTHLLNKKFLSRDLPPWLEEGLATDLGYLWIEDLAAQLTDLRGQEKPEKVVGWDANMVQLNGYLYEPRFPSLAQLMELDRDSFYKNAEWTYPYCAALVRFLLDGGNDRYAQGFKSYLGQIAGGEKPKADLLLTSLGITSEDLDRQFRSWAAKEAFQAQKRVEVHRAQFYRDQWALEQEALRQK